MLRIILLLIPIILVSFVIVVALQPADFLVTRAITIAAPAAVIFPHVDELRKWEAWSPWEKVDPTLKKTYAGPAAGIGAHYAWVGNSKVGAGSMTITEIRQAEFIRLRLDFLKPFKATHVAEFTFQPAGGQTSVTWTMRGKKIFATKAIGLIMNMDKMIGGQFEQGLSNLAAVAVAAAKS